MVVDSAGSVVVGTVEASVVSVAEELGEAVALADLVVGSADFAVEGSGGRSIDQLKFGRRNNFFNDQKNRKSVE